MINNTNENNEIEKELTAGEETCCTENSCQCKSEVSEELPSEEEILEEPANLAKQIETLQAKIAEMNDSHLRLMAEYDNYRRRTLKEKADLIKNGGERAFTSILSVVDDFERAIAAMENTNNVEAVKEGIMLIYHKFGEYLKQNNVALIETVEAPFDTEYHEAITTIPAPTEALKGKIIDCVQKGYTLNEKVIRFAKVVVGE